eukprot:48670-Prorocentrum_lima.AAC.1
MTASSTEGSVRVACLRGSVRMPRPGEGVYGPQGAMLCQLSSPRLSRGAAQTLRGYNNSRGGDSH